MRKLIFIAFMVMSVCGYAQKYEVGTTTAVWKAPAAADFLHAKAIGVKWPLINVIGEFLSMK